MGSDSAAFFKRKIAQSEVWGRRYFSTKLVVMAMTDRADPVGHLYIKSREGPCAVGNTYEYKILRRMQFA